MAETRFHEIAERIHDLLEAGQREEIRALLTRYQATEIADEFDLFSVDEQLTLLRQMPDEQAADVFECLEEPQQQELLPRFRPERQATILREMEPDERADLFQALPDDLAAKFLAMLPRQEKEEVRELVGYEAHTAGGLMTPEFAWVSSDMTVSQAIQKFRQNYADLEMVYYIYVLGDEGRLMGLASMRQMLLHDPSERIGDIMFRHVISVQPDTDQEEVAQILTLYDFYALPVVDESRKMLGIVTFDDVADVMEEEAGEDLERFSALLPSEQAYDKASVWNHVRRRVPWLLALLALSSISGFIILHAQRRFMKGEQNTGVDMQQNFLLYGLLIALYPMLTATAGNAGTQAATVMVRGLATGEIHSGNRRRVFWKEVHIGVVMGAVLAVLGFARAMVSSRSEYWLFLGCSVGGALVAMLLIANLMGALLPLLFEKVGWDPALMSGPLIATLTDILSAIVYFSIAAVVALYLFPLS